MPKKSLPGAQGREHFLAENQKVGTLILSQDQIAMSLVTQCPRSEKRGPEIAAGTALLSCEGGDPEPLRGAAFPARKISALSSLPPWTPAFAGVTASAVAAARNSAARP
jgi:hypothetical protein